MNVIVATFTHKHGIDSRVFTDFDGAEAWRQSIANQWWETVMDEPKPSNPAEMADAYFHRSNELGDEFFETTETPLEGAPTNPPPLLKALKDIRTEIDTIEGYWTEGLDNFAQQADAAITAAEAGQIIPPGLTVKVWSLVTDGENLGHELSVFPTLALAVDYLRSNLATDQHGKPRDVAALTEEQLCDLWENECDGMCSIEEHEIEVAAPVAPSLALDWQAMARDLAAEIDSCTHQIEQMKGMFDDADGSIAKALGSVDETLERFHKARAVDPAAPAPITLTISMEGGLVQNVSSDHPALIGAAYTLIDYDIEGADREQIKTVTFANGQTQQAYIGGGQVEASFETIAPSEAAAA